MKVREATDQDAVSILYLCEAFWRETPHFKDVMFDQEKTMRFILQHILDDQCFVCWYFINGKARLPTVVQNKALVGLNSSVSLLEN